MALGFNAGHALFALLPELMPCLQVIMLRSCRAPVDLPAGAVGQGACVHWHSLP